MGSRAEPQPPRAEAPNEQGAADETSELRSRVAALERERDQLVAVVGIQREIASGVDFVDVLQSITQILGRSFALDRCSIYLAGGPGEARLVASYENPAIRNLVVDLARYPELSRVFATGEPVLIADATEEQALAPAREALALRNVGAIAVVPIAWGGSTVGAIFLRTDRDAAHGFSPDDVRFFQVVASLAAQALNAARGGDPAAALHAGAAGPSAAAVPGDARRALLLAVVYRLLERDALSAPPLAPASADEADRLAEVVTRVIAEEAGRA